eukprot:scaffold119138_cov31-Tisochrysis_lutea.AAC.4
MVSRPPLLNGFSVDAERLRAPGRNMKVLPTLSVGVARLVEAEDWTPPLEGVASGERMDGEDMLESDDDSKF